MSGKAKGKEVFREIRIGKTIFKISNNFSKTKENERKFLTLIQRLLK